MPEIFPFGSKAKLNTANDSTLQEEPKSAKKIFISFRPFVIKILLATFLDVLTAMSFWNIYPISNTYTSNKLFHSSTDEDRGRIIIEENNSPLPAQSQPISDGLHTYTRCALILTCLFVYPERNFDLQPLIDTFIRQFDTFDTFIRHFYLF